LDIMQNQWPRIVRSTEDLNQLPLPLNEANRAIVRIEKYIAQRSSPNLGEYYSIFGRITGMSRTVKLSAAQKILRYFVDGITPDLSPKEIEATQEGNLGKTLNEIPEI